jgi:hypothetical protein
MPLRKAAAAIKIKIEQAHQEQLLQGIPGDRVKNQLPPYTLPPGGPGGSGYPPDPDAVTRIDVRKNSAGTIFSRRRLNLIEGTGATLTVADDGANEEVDITIAISSAGTVTSVGLTAPSEFAVSGSPITTSGTIALSWTTESANLLFAGPASGSAASPTFRALSANDIPNLSAIYQPLDSDLTSIAALATTSYGRGFLPLVDASAARAYIGAGTGGGTVTSVGLTAPTEISVSGSPITSSGTIALTWANETANRVLAGPSTGSPATPAFRALVAADMPSGTLTGSGAAGEIAYWSGASALTGSSAFLWDTTSGQLRILTSVAGVDAIQVISGATGDAIGIGLGRVASEVNMGVVALASQFFAASAAGDSAIKVASSSKKLLLGAGSAHTLAISSSDVTNTGGTNLGTATGASAGQLRMNNSSYQVYWDNVNTAYRTNASMIVDGNIYWGTGAAYLSAYLNQAVLTSSNVTFNQIASTGAISVPRSSGTGLFALDGTNQGSALSIANNGTATPFGASRNFSGLIVISETAVNGSCAVFVADGGGGVALVSASVANTWTTTSGTASRTNVYLVSGAVTIENKLGSTATYNIIALRTRTI